MDASRVHEQLSRDCRKTTEIRVNDASRKKIKEGSLIRFRCRGDQVLTRVTPVARYADFDEMFAHESVASVNPPTTREKQLANIRQIYPPKRESPRHRRHRHRTGRPTRTTVESPSGNHTATTD